MHYWKVTPVTLPKAQCYNRDNDWIIDIYWKEYCDFDDKSGIFANQCSFLNMFDAVEGWSHFWHELYSYSYPYPYPYTKFWATFHVEQLLSIWVLDLLSYCGAMTNRSMIVQGQTLVALLLKNRQYCTVHQNYICWWWCQIGGVDFASSASRVVDIRRWTLWRWYLLTVTLYCYLQ